jgi:hypothetical protein
MSSRFIRITLVLLALGLSIEWGFSGYLWVLGALLDIAFIALIVTVFRRIFARRALSFHLHFLRNTLFCWAIIWGFSLFLVFLAVLSNTFPGALSIITLTNEKRTLVFVQMSHIGSPSYYDAVSKRLTDLARAGYSIYAEWVGPGTPENRALFDQKLGIKIGSGTYHEFADILGMRAQDDTLFVGIPDTQIRSVDLTLDQIVALMGTGQTLAGEDPIDLTSEFARLRDARSWPLLPYILRAVMNISLRYTDSHDLLLDQMRPDVRDAIISGRNTHVIDTFLSDTAKDVVIVYGALHFQGMYEYLRAADPSWRIERLEALYPYTP